MTLNEYIESLTSLQEEYGNLPLIYSKDDEGNSYHKVINVASLATAYDLDSYYIEQVEFEERTLPANVIVIN